ncbi:unnamed protein product [Leptidea sinapis]|uniref:Uncharacterized protein n=1 Tax=Leptidea sinapis TaxID=189913 RepID=A0A5E4QH55_9NEOP|nr:unnamed protein product [Leptidea sinapis]
MSSPKTPPKRISQYNTKFISFKNNAHRKKTPNNAQGFITWYKNLFENEIQKTGLYLADDVRLEWFGRTVRTKKKVFGFLREHMQHSKHFLTSVKDVDRIHFRHITPKKVGTVNSESPEIKFSCLGKRRFLQSRCTSPEWAPGCKPDEEYNGSDKKKSKSSVVETISPQITPQGNLFKEVNGNGDSIVKRHNTIITPPNKECGQGDCLPSTSSSDSNRSHDALTAQLPKLAVECNGFVEFTRVRSGDKWSNVENVKWERKCKLQISYSEDPLNLGEFIIWGISYSGESKCRRNLLAAFEEVEKEKIS